MLVSIFIMSKLNKKSYINEVNHYVSRTSMTVNCCAISSWKLANFLFFCWCMSVGWHAKKMKFYDIHCMMWSSIHTKAQTLVLQFCVARAEQKTQLIQYTYVYIYMVKCCRQCKQKNCYIIQYLYVYVFRLDCKIKISRIR